MAKQAQLLATNDFCHRPHDIAVEALAALKPRVSLTTIEWSTTRRVVRKPDGTKTDWSPTRSKALLPIMVAHDNPAVREIIVPKPSRIGGTMIAENFAAKCLDNGPSWDVMWYLAGPNEVTSYADRVLRPLMEDHFPGRLPKAGTDGNTKTLKRVGSQTFELMVMSKTTTTNRQAGYIVFDEPDSYGKAWRSNFLEQGRQRQSDLGTDRKIYACAHPDVGWSGGIAAAWILSTQGIYVFRCPKCGTHGSPYPTKHWPDVPRFRLSYEKAEEGTPVDQRLALAGRTAAIACPHGCELGELERGQMIDDGAYMHKGQVLDVEAGIIGEVEENETWGFWVHVLMSGQVPLSSLARQLEGALEHKERTGKNDKLKQVLVRTFGEAFESEADLTGIDAAALRRRTAALARPSSAEDEGVVDFPMGFVPRQVRFITASVDPGHRKADVLLRGWDLERRSWLIDRFTIRQRKHADGMMRDIDLLNVQDDWHVLDAVIDRLVPIQNRPGEALPVAVMMIDSGDGNITHKAYEYCRRMAGRKWGAWPRVRPLKGMAGKRPHLGIKPTWLSVDDDGKKIDPPVPLHIAGVDGLKDDLFGNDDGAGFLLIDDGSPGQIYFASDFPQAGYDELFREPKIEGTYVRNGAQETIDLLAYTECGRLLLKPDREDIDWAGGKLPPWAKPVSLKPKGGDHADAGRDDAPAKPVPAAPKRTAWDAMNRNGPR
ncbi:phage terminase large subunit GpA-like protein [Novosphingobium chloroacetimidivorans]|uniref:Phage terminase large subunit GpA-like protein n=1 Tax=Novosphingobium chloroacetimidivorans TaxID=1428314 RepID=A0A7W7NWJ5_9SPHN|nr:terminase gpA endonuclease subunit [Novosphingobium chloroacetimidivorans]MBB4859643.1 phage terminase large subunit GpA-like protein [Novosphingobium chloroacetimidivorans]